MQPSTMFIWDNLEIMRGIDSDCIDLIYLDPPFNSKCNYAAPIGSQAAGAEFKDMWSLNDVDAQWISLIAGEHPDLHAILKAVPDDSDKSYLVYMSVRLLEMHRILKPTGSIYLHCDPTMNAWLRILCDTIFGKDSFRNEIVWCYGDRGRAAKGQFGRKHDTLLYYGHNKAFNPQYLEMSQQEIEDKYPFKDNKGRYYWHSRKSNRKAYFNGEGKNVLDHWTDIPIVNQMATERTGYPTQKPLALLNRIIKASSNEGDWILDPFCGCATTCVAAHLLGRKWIGIDISPTAGILVQRRIDKELGSDMIASGRATYYEPISRTDIPIQSGEQVQPRAYKETLYGKQKGICNLCGIHFPYRNLTIDHIVPKSKGGQDLETNLQLLCQACNSSKGARDMAQMQALFSSYKPTQSNP